VRASIERWWQLYLLGFVAVVLALLGCVRVGSFNATQSQRIATARVDVPGAHLELNPAAGTLRMRSETSGTYEFRIELVRDNRPLSWVFRKDAHIRHSDAKVQEIVLPITIDTNGVPIPADVTFRLQGERSTGVAEMRAGLRLLAADPILMQPADSGSNVPFDALAYSHADGGVGADDGDVADAGGAEGSGSLSDAGGRSSTLASEPDDHAIALRLSTIRGPWSVLVLPQGELSEPDTSVDSPLLVNESEQDLFAIRASHSVRISRRTLANELFALPADRTTEDALEDWSAETRDNMLVLLGQRNTAFWSRLYQNERSDPTTLPPSMYQAPKSNGAVPDPTALDVSGKAMRVKGRVRSSFNSGTNGSTASAVISAFDGENRLLLRFANKASEGFEVVAPASARTWVAAVGDGVASDRVSLEERKPLRETKDIVEYDVEFDVSPGGAVHIHVVDGDTGEPLTARILVRGINGTVDPNFGPDYRASGAGPVADARMGLWSTPLPIGRYRVLATRGMEYTIDAREIDVKSGTDAHVELKPRRAVNLPQLVGSDLHVHARPSFDSPVIPEDRVLSLVAAGVRFAVPTEHNIVGNYESALRATGLALGTVPGVEVTSFAPRFGHFGVFPWPTDAKVPPFRGTSPAGIFDAVRREHPDSHRILQVNHPRMGKKIGYFEEIRYNPKTGLRDGRGRLDFDTLEVLNGFEIAEKKLHERVISDWFQMLNHGRKIAATASSDSHRILYGWAGYPRTFVDMGTRFEAKTIESVHLPAILEALKAGRSTLSAGPIVLLDVDGQSSGELLRTEAKEVNVHLRVYAAPWIDVRTLDVVFNGKVFATIDVPIRELRVGPETQSRAALEAECLRYEGTVRVPFNAPEGWIAAVARGEGNLEQYLFASPIVPIALTNPVYLARSGATPWGKQMEREVANAMVKK
jgi:hypothetical protein